MAGSSSHQRPETSRPPKGTIRSARSTERVLPARLAGGDTRSKQIAFSNRLKLGRRSIPAVRLARVRARLRKLRGLSRVDWEVSTGGVCLP